MATELAQFVEQAPICNTHDHLSSQGWWEQDKPDILRELFENYCAAELVSAGATPESVAELQNEKNPDLDGRWRPVKDAWEAVQHTGYGQAVSYIARRYFGLERLDLPGLTAAHAALPHRWAPGDRYRIFKEDAGCDHVQIDHFSWKCLPDAGAPEFFFYDLSWAGFARGAPDLAGVTKDTGVEVKDLASLRQAMEAIFAQYGPCAIAVKTQHAYGRTLAWRQRSDAEAAGVLEATLADPAGVSPERKNVLGDWCLARGVELATEHRLPVKIHTGHHAGWGSMDMEWIRPSLLCPLLAKYPKARFVLMHTGYPYGNEILSLAKQYPNVYVDMCWAWSMNPRMSAEFVRRYLHSAPINKLFAFGSDTRRPRAAVAYAWQARRWLGRALQAEVADGELTEPQALAVARRIMQDNQKGCFDLDGRRRTIRQRLPKQ